jgi:hypothetical protein
VLDKMACETEGAQDLHAPNLSEGRVPEQDPIMRRETRRVTRSKNLKIPTPGELTGSDEESITGNSESMLLINRPCGLPHRMLSLGRFNAVCL